MGIARMAPVRGHSVFSRQIRAIAGGHGIATVQILRSPLLYLIEMFFWRLSFLVIPTAALTLGVTQPGLKKPTFSKDIAPIVYKRCISCHSDSHIAPFSLVGYQNVRDHAATIAKVTALGVMPPWKAKAGYGEFKDVQALSNDEKAMIEQWSKSGAPEGDASETPVPPTFVPGWRLGQPDLIIAPAKPTNIPAEGSDFFRDYLIDPHVTKATWVRAVDFMPLNSGTVHHIIPSLVTKDEVEKLKKIKYDFDDDSWKQKSIGEIKKYNVLGFWSTGAPPFESPIDTAFLINPGDQIVLDVHYKTTGKSEIEQPKVAFYNLKDAPKDEMSVNVVAAGDIYVQPGEVSRFYAIGNKTKVKTTIYAVWPHMHYIGRTFKAWVKFPEGYSKPLIAIESWDPEWQLLYHLKSPMVLPIGSKIYVTGTYDNSSKNPRNPNFPPKVIESGESSKDEMLFFELFQVEEKPKIGKGK